MGWRKKKILFKEDIVRAMKYTKSGHAAARYLGVSYTHYVMYSKMFFNEETGLSLFEMHSNQSGKGIPKRLKNDKTGAALRGILDGTLDPTPFSPEKIKGRLIAEGYLADECYRCGFNERRIVDYRVPLILHFKNGNKKHYLLENLELICYNCYFLYISDPITPKEIALLEDFNQSGATMVAKSEKITFDLDDDILDNMRDLGII